MVNNHKLSKRNVLKAVSKHLQALKNEKPVQSDDPEETKWMNSVKRRDKKNGLSALLKLASGDEALNESESLFVHAAVFFHDASTANLDQGAVFDLVEAVLNRK